MGPVFYQITGVVLAGFVLLLLHYKIHRFVRETLAGLLVAAALIYIGFALGANATSGQVLVEVAGLVMFGSFAWLGMTRSQWWLALGWLLHPLWDVGLHLFGPAKHLAPDWYAHACLTFDLVIGGYVAYMTWRTSPTSEGAHGQTP